MKNLIQKIGIVLVVALLVHACANKAQGPTGGPKDETPPRVVRSTPLNGSVNFKKKQIEIIFDENISIEKPGELIVISPPQLKQPEIKGNSKTISVSFEDNLKDSTTYTINFGSSIVDLNEKNVLKDYRFAFATGSQIDTLQISGMLVNAEDLNPVSGILVGIHAIEPDSAIYKVPFIRIGRTDEKGHFSIDNMKPGKYKVFALGDVSKDNIFQPGESVAFIDSIVSPTVRIEEKRDTIWKDSITVDSVHTYMGPRFLPDTLLFKLFKETKKRQYFLKSERKQAQSFSLFFNAKADSLPIIKPLNFNWDNKVLVQKNATLDSLTYWLKDSAVYGIDTLKMQMTYLKTDSLFRYVPQIDTLEVFERKGKVNTKAKKSVEKVIEYLKVNDNASSQFDVFAKLLLKFEAPLEFADVSKMKLKQKVDTLFKDLALKWNQEDSTQMLYSVSHKWEPEESYLFTVDSAAIQSIYGLVNKPVKSEFKVKSLEEYSAIRILAATFDSLVVFQVLDNADKVLATKPAHPKGTLFEYLKPGEFFLRAFIDRNKNGKWDTGELSSRTQPEEVLYYPKKLTLRANWEFEETWDLQAVPLLEQKPAELIKDANKKQGE